MTSIEGHPGLIQPKATFLTVKHATLTKVHTTLLTILVNNRPTLTNKAILEGVDEAFSELDEMLNGKMHLR